MGFPQVLERPVQDRNGSLLAKEGSNSDTQSPIFNTIFFLKNPLILLVLYQLIIYFLSANFSNLNYIQTKVLLSLD